MKYIYTMLPVLLLTACAKQRTTPHHTLSLQQQDGIEIPVENIDANWDYETGRLDILAEGTDHQLLKLHTHTLHNNKPCIADVCYSEDEGFAAADVTTGSIDINEADATHATGTAFVTFTNQAHTATKTIIANFTIYTQQ